MVGYNTERGTETLLTLCFALTVQGSLRLRGKRLPKCTWKGECEELEQATAPVEQRVACQASDGFKEDA